MESENKSNPSGTLTMGYTVLDAVNHPCNLEGKFLHTR